MQESSKTSERYGVTVADGLADSAGLTDADGVGDTVAVGEADSVGVGLADSLGGADSVGDGLGLGAGVGFTLGAFTILHMPALASERWLIFRALSVTMLVTPLRIISFASF